MKRDRVTSAAVARQWIRERRRLAVATLVDVAGSAPLDEGAMMFFDDRGNIEGSVTGGCVEGALVQDAARALAGDPPSVRTFGVSDALAGSVGLMCGGTVEVFVEALSESAGEVLELVLAEREAGRPTAIAALLDGPGAGARLAIVGGEGIGGLGGGALLDANVERELRGALHAGRGGLRRYGADGATLGGDLRVHLAAYGEAPRLIVFGAIDYAVAVALLAREIGYRVTIVDAREPFLRSPRFSSVAEIAIDWPDRYLDGQALSARDAVLVCSHDPKFDEPAITAALRSGAGYVGALGSRRTQADRAERLRRAGVSEAELARVAAPCGLDIGARTPAETAISILAEIIATASGRDGRPLAEGEEAIHARADPDRHAR